MSADRAAIPRVERLLALRSCSTFRALAPLELARMAEQLRPQWFAPGSELLRAGVPLGALAFLVRGEAELFVDRAARRVTPFSVLGDVADLLAEAPAARVIAQEPTLTLELERGAFEDLLEDEFGIFLGILRAMAHELPCSREPAFGGGSGAELVLREPTELGLVERILVLRHALEFAGAEIDALAELGRCCAEVALEPGAALWRVGERSDDFLIVISGRVEARDAAESFAFEAGSAPGVLDSLARDARSFSATATSRVRALSVPMHVLIDVIEDHPQLGMKLLRAIARTGTNAAGRLAQRGT